MSTTRDPMTYRRHVGRHPVTRLRRAFEILMASEDRNELVAAWNFLHDKLWVHPSPDVLAKFYPGGTHYQRQIEEDA